MNDRESAQRRIDDLRAYGREAARLEAEGVVTLTSADRERVAGHHAALIAAYARDFDVDADPRGRRLSLGMRAASFLGAIAFAASVFFALRQFWGHLGDAAQVAILAGGSLASLAATLAVRTRDTTGYFTNLVAMVAFACFVLNVALVGRAFNLTPSDTALLVWAVYAFLLAYACDSRLLLAAGIACLMGWIAARAGAWRGVYWIDLGERPENFFPAAIALLCVPAFVAAARRPGFAPVYRVLGLIALLLPVLVLSFWGRLSYIDAPASAIESGYQFAGFALAAATVWLGARRDWSDVFHTGVTFFVLFLYTKFFTWWWDVLPKWLFFLIVGASALAVLFVLRRLRRAPPTAAAAGGGS